MCFSMSRSRWVSGTWYSAFAYWSRLAKLLSEQIKSTLHSADKIGCRARSVRSKWSNVTRHPPWLLLSSCVVKKWDTRYKITRGSPASSYKWDRTWKPYWLFFSSCFCSLAKLLMIRGSQRIMKMCRRGINHLRLFSREFLMIPGSQRIMKWGSVW